MSDGEKALWLINKEREDRGVPPLHGLEMNVTGVAQYYADYLLEHNTSGHTADGRSPYGRLDDNPEIGACREPLDVVENIAYHVTTGSSIDLPVERTVYAWIYWDASVGWGHRHVVLWHPYDDNSGTAGMEGFLGLGRGNGGPYQGPFSKPWNFAEIILMDVFDPCSTWSHATYVDAAARCCGNPSPCYASIQTAIGSAASGELIIVSGGTYNEAVTIENVTVVMAPSICSNGPVVLSTP
jgi:hypothetical protein